MGMQKPDVALTFGGDCLQDFSDGLKVYAETSEPPPTIVVSSIVGEATPGFLIVSIEDGVSGVQPVTTQRALDSEIFLSVHEEGKDRDYSNNGTMNAGSVSGMLTINGFDAGSVTMDLVFSDVVLVDPNDNANICTINGSVTTYGAH